MRALAPILLLACGTPPEPTATLPVDQAGPIADTTGDFVVGAIVPGDLVRLTIADVPPNLPVWFFASMTGPGRGPCPARMNGDCFDMAPPGWLVARADANADGWATATLRAPTPMRRSTVWFQAVAFDAAGNSYKSDVFARGVGLGACPALWAPVCGLDGQDYGNACEAEQAGMLVAAQGPC